MPALMQPRTCQMGTRPPGCRTPATAAAVRQRRVPQPSYGHPYHLSATLQQPPLCCAALAEQQQQQQSDQRFAELTTWLEARGGSVGSITAGDCQMGPVVVRGLVATQDIPARTPILQVPVSSTLQDTRAPQPYPGAPWNVCLAVQLLQERSKGHSSAWWPYLATLPSDCCSPLLLPEQALSEIQYAPAIAAVAEFQAAAREALDRVNAAQQQQQQQWSWEEWAWALHMVQSRSIRLAQMGCKVMIPGMDLLNHGGAAANGQMALGKASWQVEGEPAVVFVTTQDVAAGEQVLWSYGRRSSDDFFAYHGFVLLNNPDEDVVLFEDVAALTAWALQHLLPHHQGPSSGVQQQQQYQQMQAVAEAAAHVAAQEAAAHCSSAAIPGTTSSLLVPMAALAQNMQTCLQRQQQQQQDQPQDLHQQQRLQQERWQERLQRSGSQSTAGVGGSSSSSGSGSSGGSGLLEAAVLASLKGLQLERRLASLRLHSPEWGAPTCPPSTPELVLRHDGCIDVRVPAVLAALMDATEAAAAAAGFQGVLSSNSSAAAADTFQRLLQSFVSSCCKELLQDMPTTIAQDQAELQQLQQQQQQLGVAGSGDSDAGLMCAVLEYRLAKKQLLQQFCGSSAL